MNLLKRANQLRAGGCMYLKDRSRLVRSELGFSRFEARSSIFRSPFLSDLLYLHRQSAYLAGRDRMVADIHTEHPSCSKQHAALQFRQVKERDEFGDTKLRVKCVTTPKPFLMLICMGLPGHL